MTFIPDQEISLNTQNDLLGINIYAETLTTMINNNLENNKPVTVGLFGGAGSGKSSISKTVVKRLKKNKKTKVMIYDAWKYSTDAFRGSFISELRDQFTIDEKKLNGKKNHTEQKIIQERRFKKTLIITILAIFVIGVLMVSLLPKLTKIHTAFNIFTNTGLIFLIIFILERSFSEKRTAFRSFTTEEFENIFNSTVERIIDKKREIKKLVIFIDNVDRCPRELTKELLFSVKSFLSNKHCIFILPMDHNIIKKHLEHEQKDPARFFRRFFNTTINLKKLTPQNLYEFTRELIKKYNLDFNDEIAYLFSQEFSDSPRKVIQYLNNLQTEIIIAQKQENNGFIKQGAITENLEFLAKILIIREEWPALYDDIIDKPYIIKEIRNAIKNDKIKYDTRTKLYTMRISKDIYDNTLTLNQVQFWFFKRNIAITAENIEDFLNIEDIDKDMPLQVKKLIYKQDWEKIKSLIETEDIDIDNFFALLYQELDLALIKRRLWKTDGFNLLSLLFTVVADADYEKYFEKRTNFYEPFIHNENIKNILGSFHPYNVVKYAKKLYKEDKDYLQKYIVDAINQNRVENSELLQAYKKIFKVEIL